MKTQNIITSSVSALVLASFIFWLFRWRVSSKGILEDNAKKIEELHPKFRRRTIRFLQDAEKAGFNLRITEAARSDERQGDLYAISRTEPGKKVTNARPGESFHGEKYGLAFDVVDRMKSYDIDWDRLGKIAKKHKIEHPLKWDKPHFQQTFGYTVHELMAKVDAGDMKNGFVKI